jgi:hypothetical protein
MLSLSYAKTLFLVALALSPQGTHAIMATSNDKTYVWTASGRNWSMKAKGYPSTDWISEGKASQPLSDRDAQMLRRHDFSDGAPVFLENGDRVEEKGGAAFCIIDPGQANQNVFTILFAGHRK